MQQSSAHLRWQALNRRLARAGLLTVKSARTPLTTTVGEVVIFGRYQLELAVLAKNPTDRATLDQALQNVMDAAAAIEPHANPDFSPIWHDAMCREMGSEEVEKFLLSWRKPHHDETTK
jgi:hypothetical protein